MTDSKATSQSKAPLPTALLSSIQPQHAHSHLKCLMNLTTMLIIKSLGSNTKVKVSSVTVLIYYLRKSPIAAVQISSTQLVWAPPLEYPAGLPDITVHTTNNIWQYIGENEFGVGDSHFNHPRIVRTVYPVRDELDRLANGISSI